MTVNLDKNRESLVKAWRDVVDDKTKTDWAVLGYEAQTFNLQVVETGDGGLMEMADNLNSGMIMYAFCRVLDPKTSLPKYVLINWQGDGAPVDKKGKCANHIRDVSNLFKGAHVTFNARNEDEVDPDDILEKVSRATVSHFSFSQRDGPLQSHQPVSSVYKRTLAAAEINPSERDKFWEQEEIAEKHRVAEEKRKADEAKKRLEEERKDREMKEAKVREEHIVEKARRLSVQSSAEKSASQPSDEKKRWEKQLEEDKVAEGVRKNRSEMLREERRNEAQTLIAQRTFNARAVFEQNTWKSQMSSSSSSSPRTPNVIDPAPSDDKNSRFDFSNHVEQPAPNKPPPPPASYNNTPPQQPEPEVSTNGNVAHQQNGATSNGAAEVVEQAAEQGLDTNGYEDAYSAALTAQGLRARALYDYQAADDTELSFDPDDIITNIEQVDEGWWQGMAPDGTYGLFPANYVELLDD